MDSLIKLASKRMKKAYYLGTCSTCVRIMNSLDLSDFEKQDIKTDKISSAQIEQMKEMAGSYEALFSKRAMKYKSLGLKEKNLSEADFKQYILEEYTFLKRPVFIVDNQIFVGNAKSNIEKLAAHLNK